MLADPWELRAFSWPRGGEAPEVWLEDSRFGDVGGKGVRVAVYRGLGFRPRL